ncbi:hypothetical protein M513_07168 [Trichuris suis]|uniref:Uncharacterized protein n=1 Tax=Trichuris suis TaxID=68888 RepID=A0A085M3P3_9BILA|nr:hypothetical protein M513_07168 [Trichuris suis]
MVSHGVAALDRQGFEGKGPPPGPFLESMSVLEIGMKGPGEDISTYMDSFMANCAVCVHKLRQWRQRGADVSFVDLKKAYLQVLPCLIGIQPECDLELSLAPDVQISTPTHTDDIFFREDVVSANRVKLRLEKPEGLEERGSLPRSRGCETGNLPKRLTGRTVSAYCGELVGHYPVCS